MTKTMAAQRLKVSERMISIYLSQGKLRGIIVDGKTLVTEASLERFATKWVKQAGHDDFGGYAHEGLNLVGQCLGSMTTIGSANHRTFRRIGGSFVATACEGVEHKPYHPCDLAKGDPRQRVIAI